MGLDTVEIVMEVEEAFDFKITDAEAGACRTVGDVYELVLAKSPGLRPAGSCLSRVAFHRLRQVLVQLIQVDRRAIRPRTSLESLFDTERRPAVWQRLEELLGFHLPMLERDGRLDRLAHWYATGFAAGMLAAPFAALFHPTIGLFLVAAGLVSLGGCMICLWNEYCLAANLLPAGIVTVGDLAHSIKWHYRGEVDEAARSEANAAAHAAWEKLVTIFCEQLSLQRDQVKPEADIIRDLGAD